MQRSTRVGSLANITGIKKGCISALKGIKKVCI